MTMPLVHQFYRFTGRFEYSQSYYPCCWQFRSPLSRWPFWNLVNLFHNNLLQLNGKNVANINAAIVFFCVHELFNILENTAQFLCASQSKTSLMWYARSSHPSYRVSVPLRLVPTTLPTLLSILTKNGLLSTAELT
jgi:hypothetical protein